MTTPTPHVDELAEKVWKVKRRAIIELGPCYEPNIVIYISPEFAHCITQEAYGPLNPLAFELVENGTIMGHPVYRAIDFNPVRGQSKIHPKYEVLLNGYNKK